MKKLIFIISIIFFQSCITTHFKPAGNNYETTKIFSDTTKSYLYRTKIKLFDNDFSGLLVFKPQTKGHRIVFINEIGMKFFDIELLKNSYKVHHIFEPMNKKMFIKLLVNDFNFILMNNIQGNIKYSKEKKSGKLALISKGTKSVYYFDNNTLLPVSAFRYSAIRKNIFLNYYDCKNKIPQNINIKHKNIQFEMNLNFIK